MYYQFQDQDGEEISTHENKVELIKKVRAYYKAEAMDREYSEYEIIGDIVKYNNFDEAESKEAFYEVGNVPMGRSVSPYQQSEFI